MAARRTPLNEAESGVQDAFTVLARNREHAAVNKADLLAVCHAAPDYALQLIDKHRSTLLNAAGSAQPEIADLVCEVEWALRGANAFIAADHAGMHGDNFIHDRLVNHPDDFTREALHILIHRYSAEHRIHTVAVERLSHHVSSLAERIASQPPRMSEDLAALKRSITNYGFTPALNEVLQKIDDQLQQEADPFDQVATMGHIRSFFEKIHECVGRELQSRRPNVGNGTPLSKCGQAIDYLERKQVITSKVHALAKSLYGILSDGSFGVHALKADRDYTRLCRNMVIEYATTLFFELDRRLLLPGDS